MKIRLIIATAFLALGAVSSVKAQSQSANNTQTPAATPLKQGTARTVKIQKASNLKVYNLSDAVLKEEKVAKEFPAAKKAHTESK